MAHEKHWNFEQREIRLKFGLSLKAWPGTCFALSYDWCKSVLSGRIPERNPYDLNKDYLWTITSMHRAYRDAPGSVYKYLSQLCKGDNILLKPELTGNQMDQSLVDIIDDDAKIPALSAVIIGAPGHAMAFTKQQDSRGYFFDPNDGQYKLSGSIGTEVVSIVKDGYPGKWNLRIMSGQPRDHQHYEQR